MRVTLVAAVARGGVIGRDGSIPWRIPEDLARFRELTTGHPVVMGRRTWDSLPNRFRPLPGRRNLVVTRQEGWSAPGAERAASLEDALRLVADADRVFVIGGAELYAAALPLTDELVLTEVDADVQGDAFFPDWERNAFTEVSRDERTSADGTPFAFVTYRRSQAAKQLAALDGVGRLLDAASLDYWMFGGWAVDFYAGRVTRPHDDVDVAVWLEDLPRIVAALEANGWRHAPDPDADGGTGFERDGVRLELTYIERAEGGRVVTRLRDFEAAWPDGAFESDERELAGVRARLVGLAALATGKSVPRTDPDEAAKDEADFAVLSGL